MEKIAATFIRAKTKKPADSDKKCWGVFLMEAEQLGTFTAVGRLTETAMVGDLLVELGGTWTNTKYGKQFTFVRHSVLRPVGKYGTMAFLQLAPNVGPRLSERLWDYFGEDTLKVITNQKLVQDAQIKGLRLDILETAIPVWQSELQNGNTTRSLVDLFANHGFPKNLPETIAEEGWADPYATIKENPFWLLRYPRVGFATCDKLRAALNLPKDMPERQTAAVRYVLTNTFSSDTWIESSDLYLAVATTLDHTSNLQTQQTLDFVETEGHIQHAKKHGKTYYGLIEAIGEEFKACTLVWKAVQNKQPWPEMDKISGITKHQLDEAKRGMENGQILFLLGSAGTGKTTTAAAIVRQFNPDRVVACAPTGKAAQRLGQAFREKGVQVIPRTIHSTLGAYPDKHGWQFRIGQLAADLVVVDEIGMLDNWLCIKLLEAIPPTAKIIMLGDPAQLPPVGRGTLLRDWQHWCKENPEAGTYGLLTEIHRNEGEIVAYCGALSEGSQAILNADKNPYRAVHPVDNLRLLCARTEEEMQNHLMEFLSALREQKITLLDGTPAHPTKDVQVVVAINKDSPASRNVINKKMQTILNPRGGGEHSFYRVGDKVICTANAQYPLEDEHEIKQYIANGELGYVVEAKKRYIIVCMNNNPSTRVRIPTGEENGGFDLGYAVTCHKMQGDQAPIIFVIPGMSYRSNMVTSREWLYTALTRASQLCYVCGTNSLLQNIGKKISIWERVSFCNETFSMLQVPLSDISF